MQINEIKIGQELYAITQKLRRCPICENVYDDDEWFVKSETSIIEKLEMLDEFGLFYHTKDCLIPPQSINKYFFTTQQAAQDECDRRNREKRGEKI